MTRLISVDADLEPVKEFLVAQGYQIVDFGAEGRPVDAVVFSGTPLSVKAARQVITENTALVNAAGLTPEEVTLELENKLG
jgi:Uncharacterised protein family (UPF0180).